MAVVSMFIEFCSPILTANIISKAAIENDILENLEFFYGQKWVWSQSLQGIVER